MEKRELEIKKNKYYVHAAARLITGGESTCYIRMVKWFRTHGYTCVLFEPAGSEYCKDILQLIDDGDVILVQFRYRHMVIFDNQEFLEALFDKNNEILCMAYSVYGYAFLDKYFSKFTNKILLYIIWQGDAIAVKRIFDRYLVKKIRNSFMLSIIHANRMIVMDNETREICSNYFKVEEDNFKVVRLGFSADFFSVAHKESKNAEETCFKKEKFIVLSAARMDFPFKGYMKGLVLDFKRFHDKHKDSLLWLVGDGENMADLKDIIDSLDDGTKNCIKLWGTLKNEDLRSLYRQADVYVGMGTTLIEAVSCRTIAIIALAFQYENISWGFFPQVDAIGVPIEGRFSEFLDFGKYRKFTFYELIEKVYQMSDSEREEMERTALEYVIENYNIDNAMKQIIKIQPSSVQNESIMGKFIKRLYLQKLYKNAKSNVDI